MRLHVVISSKGADSEDALTYIAARLLVSNGRRIDFVSNCEPEYRMLTDVGIEDTDCGDIGLLESIGDAPSGGQCLFIGHGRPARHIIDVLKILAMRGNTMDAVWVADCTQVVRIRELVSGLDDQNICVHVTHVLVEDGFYAYRPENSAQFRVALRNIHKSLKVILGDLQDLDCV